MLPEQCCGGSNPVRGTFPLTVCPSSDSYRPTAIHRSNTRKETGRNVAGAVLRRFESRTRYISPHCLPFLRFVQTYSHSQVEYTKRNRTQCCRSSAPAVRIPYAVHFPSLFALPQIRTDLQPFTGRIHEKKQDAMLPEQCSGGSNPVRGTFPLTVCPSSDSYRPTAIHRSNTRKETGRNVAGAVLRRFESRTQYGFSHLIIPVSGQEPRFRHRTHWP